MITITAHLQGEQVIHRRLRAIEERARDATPAWPAVIAVFKTIVEEVFATEGASTGEPWAPLKPATQRDRERQGYPGPGPILRRSGRLERSLLLGSESIVVEGPRYLALGSDVEYFVFHQSKRPRTQLPRRAVINLTEDDKHELVAPLRLWFTGHDPNAPRRSAVS